MFFVAAGTAACVSLHTTTTHRKHTRTHSFCWGGLYAVLLTQGQSPAVNAAVVYHGSLITTADVEGINAPINFQQSDPALDRQMGTTLYKQVRVILVVGVFVVRVCVSSRATDCTTSYHVLTSQLCMSVGYHAPVIPPAALQRTTHVHQNNTTLQIEEILAKKKDATITNYPKQAHGFSLRGDTAGDAAVAQAANTAFDAGRAFLDKYLK